MQCWWSVDVNGHHNGGKSCGFIGLLQLRGGCGGDDEQRMVVVGNSIMAMMYYCQQQFGWCFFNKNVLKRKLTTKFLGLVWNSCFCFCFSTNYWNSTKIDVEDKLHFFFSITCFYLTLFGTNRSVLLKARKISQAI